MVDPLLSVNNLTKIYKNEGSLYSKQKGEIMALDGVCFDMQKGETLSIVGESGCGKTTLAKLITRLMEPTKGSIFFQGQDLICLRPAELRKLRRKLQIIFQDPYASLNPRMKVGKIVGEGLEIHGLFRGEKKEELVKRVLEEVGLNAGDMNRYPGEFSGGQRQRINIARALILYPRLVVADEPVSSLDVSVKGQIIKLMQDLQNNYRFNYIFISHDLTTVEEFSHRVIVMYMGRVVESAPTRELFHDPMHIYTRALMSAGPFKKALKNKERVILEGDAPDPRDPPSGCHFHPRCSSSKNICKIERPFLKGKGNNHLVACHLY
ncbi:MAG: ATP-binding cassette domain-containing protein [Candidatus Syntrophonatronum acetioxidans]|uniref:ATP-binding cassette domain-containing protein n=1 Tax=Candidatus Syntrophonatronum acetioxidans TaxID=1795816 RepID=A0A424YID2_9FIRM|nr:MAG: ATP-binding cassette domain-containing protein [Candidatus Syntrophonatronum acetioxidans]